MSSIVTNLANILPTIRRHGDFYAAGKTAIFAPTLDVEGVGRISLPLLPVQAEQLVAAAERAPYGRGEETLIDADVRRTWQIGPEHIRLGGRDWQRTIDAIAAQAVADLGVAAPVSADLYKLLIYDTGSFFVEHRDTEKAPGMFATLVLVLPSEYSGGELVIRHRDREVCLDLRSTESSEAAFAAFYADCVHEMRPITSGYRLTLVYNLVRKGKNEQPSPPFYEAEQGRIADLLRQWVANKEAPDDDSPEKLIYPLEHAYTPAELGFDTLKNADAAVAAVLVDAAAQAACDLHLALLCIEESGSAEPRDDGAYYYRRGRRYYSEPDDEEAEDEFKIDEVIDRIETVSEWRRPDGSRPEFNALPVEEGELCPPDAFENAEPDEQYFHEATGNEGASFERTYRRAALVLWPRSRMLAILSHAGLPVSMPYLADLARRWSESGEDMESPLWREAHALSAHMLDDWPMPQWHQQSEHAALMLSILAQLQDMVRIDSFLSSVSAAGNYSGNENEALVHAAVLLPAQRTAGLIEQIIAKNAARIPHACANLLARTAADASFSSAATLLHPAATALVETLVGERVDPTPPDPWRRPAPMSPDLVVDLLDALCHIGAISLADRAVAHMLASPGVFDMDAVLVPAALGLVQRTATLDFAPVRRLRTACLEHLRTRIAEPLAPPPDFKRTSAIACKCDHCTELSRFLADAAHKEWIFKAAESLRRHVETSIRSNGCDLDCATDKRGRPYTLVCTKNQASHERRVKQRKRDIDNVAQLDAVELRSAESEDACEQ